MKLMTDTDKNPTFFAANQDAIVKYLAVVLFVALPTFGLISGPAYAPVTFGLGGLVFLLAVKALRPDRPLSLLAAAFLALCWLSILWSIGPQQSLHGALQLSAVLIAGLIVLSIHPRLHPHAPVIFASLSMAICLGGLIFTVDILSGYQLTFLHLGWGDSYMTYKYNRGLDYLALVIWPVLAWVVPRDKRRVLAMIALLAAPIALSPSGTARAAALVGLVAFMGMRWKPDLSLQAIRATAMAIPALLPFLLSIFADYRGKMASHIPTSGLHRLEIWDYMTHRIFERPLLGWGIQAAKMVPVSPEEIQHYVYADGVGIYPHNQWLQIWVELGAVGMALCLVLLWLVTRRIAQLPLQIRAYAAAAFAAAFATAMFNFEINTDSWIAALAVTALLFGLQGVADENAGRLSPHKVDATVPPILKA